MKVLFDINHPAHVHFFKNAIKVLKEKGYTVYVTSTTKEISEVLLDHYLIEYSNIGEYRKGLFLKFLDFIVVAFRFIIFIHKVKPDYILSVSSARPFGKLGFRKVKTFIFTDTEHASEQIALFKPFATKIFTPSCFTKELGKKQIRYNGYHELAYLHPNRFTPNPEILKEIGLTQSDNFFILRFISWGATHDIGQKGISFENKRKLVEYLSNHGKVIISSEKELDPEFEDYRMSLCPTKMHDLLCFASLFVGEGATMASECAMLGTPAIYVNSLDAGTLQEQSNNKLIVSLRNEDGLISLIKNYMLNISSLKSERINMRDQMLKSKIDVTSYIIEQISIIKK